MASIKQARAVVSHFHAAAGMRKADNPARHPVVAEAVNGVREFYPFLRRGCVAMTGISGNCSQARRLGLSHHRGSGRRRRWWPFGKARPAQRFPRERGYRP